MNPRQLNCPDCSTQLQETVHEDVAVDVCPNGHGVWLDKGELERVVWLEDADRPEAEEQAELARARGAMGAVMDQVASESARACPTCAGPMAKQDYPGSAILMDVCQHGYWLDSGELERIEAFGEGTRRQAEVDEMARLGHGPSPMSVRGVPIPPELLRGAALRTDPPMR